MLELLEHVVSDFVKIVYVCSDDGSAEALGDLPALPYCFTRSECVRVRDAEVCWSEWLRINDLQARIEGAVVEDGFASISFQVRGIKCGDDPEKLYQLVREHVLKTCLSTFSHPEGPVA